MAPATLVPILGGSTPALAQDIVASLAATNDRRERACDGLDQDGDGVDLCPPDADGDGVRADLDCDDSDPAVSPASPEVRCDGVDQNCDGIDTCDSDGDGWLDADDCDPLDPAIGDQCRPPEPPGLP